MMKMPSVAAASAAMGYAPGPATANETSAWGLVGIAYICHASSPGRATHAGLMSETRNRNLLARIAQLSLSLSRNPILFCFVTRQALTSEENSLCAFVTPRGQNTASECTAAQSGGIPCSGTAVLWPTAPYPIPHAPSGDFKGGSAMPLSLTKPSVQTKPDCPRSRHARATTFSSLLLALNAPTATCTCGSRGDSVE